MRELAALAFSYLGFSLFYAAKPARRPAWLSRLGAPPVDFRLAGGVAFGLALAAAPGEPSPVGALVVTTAVCAVATAFVLLAPVWPRAAWALAALSGPLGAALWWGGAHAA